MRRRPQRARPCPMSSPAKAGDPVRRGLSVQSSTSLEYGSPASRVMTRGCDFAFSRLTEPEVCIDTVPQRGSRECRVHAAPAVSCAIVRKANAHEHTGQPEHSGIPCAMALRLISCSPRRTALLPPSFPRGVPLGNLTPAPRRQDHTTSPYASATLVRRDISVHRISPHVRDDREAPFIRRETRGVMPLICPTARAEYFCARDGQALADLPVGLVDTAFRHCERSEAIHSAACGNMDCFAALAMTETTTTRLALTAPDARR